MDTFNIIMFDCTMEIKKWNKTDKIFEGDLDPIYETTLHCDVYYIDGRGFAVLNSSPKYPLYKRLNIPEIQDVYVMPEYRGQGIATALIKHCEDQVCGDMVGISVSVSPQFGVAQQMYFKMGYRPDGNGVSYDRMFVSHNSSVKCDENLCLMLIKDLR